jgi:amino acid transporter
MIWNLIIFGTLIMLVTICMQYAVPAQEAAKWGLIEIIYQSYAVIGFPGWWTNVVGAILTLTAISSLMMWTAAPVKILFCDAPKGIFGKWLSKTTKKDSTPVNGLIFQGILVTIFFGIYIVAQLNSGMNTFLVILKNLDGGAATISVLFMTYAYWKMRIQSNKYERDYQMLGHKKWPAILCTIPLGIVFIVATFFSLIPSPEAFQSDLVGSILMVVLGPVGIILAFLGCDFAFRRWRKKNPDDDSIFNVSEANEEVVLEIEKLSIKADGKTKEDKKVTQ